MKKAKKILSLMLVVAMALSMMVFTGGTASAKSIDEYTDLGSIEYKEAVELLIALGVMIGYDETTFGPEREITRETAATVIARILLGSEAADRLAPQDTGFIDVPMDRWSNKYIAYCVNVGIIVGYGDGRFGPEDPVTASQLAKMLLIALGFGKNDEFANPKTWELTAIVEGQKYGILPDFVNADFTQPATREQVALYTFETIIQPTLTYSDIFKLYSANVNVMDSTSAENLSLAERVFRIKEEFTTDANGFPARIWMRNNVAITSANQRGQILFTYTDGGYNAVSGNKEGYAGADGVRIAKRLSYDMNNDLATPAPFNDDTILVYINGVRDDSANNATAKLVSKVSGNIVSFCDMDKNNFVDVIVVTQKWAYSVSSAPVKGNGRVSIATTPITTLNSVDAPPPLTNILESAIEYPADLASGDVILAYTKMVNGVSVTVVEKAESVSGVLSSFTGALAAPTAITFEGKSYNKSELLSSTPDWNIIVSAGNFGIPSKIWLDDHGDVLRFSADAVAAQTTNYGLLVGYEYIPAALGGAASAKAAVYDAGGVYKVYNVAIGAYGVVPNQGVTIGTVIGSDEWDGSADAIIISYSLNDKGEITFAKPGLPASTYGTENTVAAPVNALITLSGASEYLTANTVFFYYEVVGGQASFAVKTGYQNATSFVGENIDYVITHGVVQAIYVQSGPQATPGNFAYITSTTPVAIEYVGNQALYSFDAYVNGEKTAVKTFDNINLFNSVGLWSYSVNAASGYAEVPGNDSSQVASEQISRVEPSYITYGASGYSVTDSNTKFYLVQTAGGVTTVFEASIAFGAPPAGYKVLGVQENTATGGAAIAVYYEIDP